MDLVREPHPRRTSVVARLFEPLNDATKQLVSPALLTPNDRIRIDVDKDGNFLVQLFGKYEGGSYHARKWLERIPERSEKLVDGKWKLGGTDITALIISSTWDTPLWKDVPAPRQVRTHVPRVDRVYKSRIVFESPEAKLLYDYLLTRFTSQSWRSQQRAAFKIEHVVPPTPENWEDSNNPLAPYQKTALFTQFGQEGSLLFMEQGTGKTPVIINRICHESKSVTGRMYRAIIVCPRNVRLNWQTEFHRFATTPGKVTIIKGGPIDRIKLFIEAMKHDPECAWSVVIMGYETVQKSWEALSMIEWDLACLDESHMVKNYKTKRFASVRKLRDLAKSRVILTGTPVSGGPRDVWSQLEFLGEGMSGFRSYTNFRSFYEVSIQTQGGYEKVVGFQNLPFLQERIARLGFVISKKEALPDLPEKLYDIVEVEMTPAQADIYNQVAEQLAVEIESELEGGLDRVLMVNNILTKMLRLAQITSGFVKWSDQVSAEGDLVKGGIEHFPGNPKIQALLEILRESPPEEKVIVWACFIPDIMAIAAALEANGINCVTLHGATSDKGRQEAEWSFNNDPKVKVLVGNPSVGGAGLNLRGFDPDGVDHGMSCSHVIYYSQNWSPINRAQSEDRAHRRGTRTSVRYTDLIVPDSIDVEIRNRVILKREIAMGIQDLRGIMERVFRISKED